MIVNQAYRFALDPNATQIQALRSHAGASRKAFNWALALVKAQMDQRAAEKTYGLTGDRLTPAVSWTLPSLRKSRSCTFTTGAIRVEVDRKHVTLPRLGTIKLHESARKLARRLEAGSARILSATIKLDGGRWYVSFSVEVDRQIDVPARPDAVVGVDVGVKHLAVLSTGEVIDNPRHLAGAAQHLRRLARRASRRVGPDRRTRRDGSKRWHKASADLARAHARVANLRHDGLHKLTTGLSAEYGTIVVEDLKVAGMVRNRKLAKAISDCGFGTIRTMLGYKTTWNGGRLVLANRWFPSSKTCSSCSAVKAKLPLRVRTFECAACGLVLDRDLNAARNLARLVERESGTGVAGDPQPQGSNGRGADRKTPLAGLVALKRPPGTATAGQTGTVSPQGGTASRVLTRAH